MRCERGCGRAIVKRPGQMVMGRRRRRFGWGWNGPATRLAAASVVFFGAVAMLVSVSQVACEGRAGPASAGAAERAAGAEVIAAARPGAIHAGASRADFSLGRIDGEPEIRVRLEAGVRSVRLSSEGGLTVSANDGGAGPGVGGAGVGRDVTVSLDARGWVVRTPEGEMGVGSDGGLWIVGAGDGVFVNGVRVPGRVRLAARSESGVGVFDVVEHVGLEDYLPGVVAKEMYTGWPRGAYEVQAVCARTYALHERMRVLGTGTARGHYDVDGDERDQAYAGLTGNSAAVEAVRATRGMVLCDGGSGQLLRAYYSSTCGGRSAGAAETWPTGPGFEFNLAGPLQGAGRECICQNAPLNRWSVQRDADELAARLRAYGQKSGLLVRKLKGIGAIETLRVNRTGRPSAYKIIEPDGTWYELSAEQFRLACNQTVRMPAGVDEEMVPAGAVGAIDRRMRVYSGDVEVVVPRTVAMDRTMQSPETPLMVTIQGRGFGHGVGMCQYCAKNFAARGEDWRTIVLRFYPGAAVRRAY